MANIAIIAINCAFLVANMIGCIYSCLIYFFQENEFYFLFTLFTFYFYKILRFCGQNIKSQKTSHRS